MSNRHRTAVLALFASLILTLVSATAYSDEKQILSELPRVATITGTINKFDGVQTNRLFRDGVPTTCANKPTQSTLAGSFHYDTYAFTNPFNRSICYKLVTTTPCTGTNFIFLGVYVPTFNPANIVTNYIADSGFSPNPTQAFTFTVPPLSQFTIVAAEVTPSGGCSTYTLDLFGELPTGDFDQNGSPDLLLRNPNTGQNALWMLNGTSYASTVDLPSLTPSTWEAGAVADFNGDGQPDIVWRNPATGQNAIWLMNGTVIASIVDLPGVSNSNLHFVGAGDLNGDGKPDLVLRDQSSGANSIWIMNGTIFSSVVSLPSLVSATWFMSGVGDFDGDGNPDILLYNSATGQTAVWLLNGTNFVTTVDLPFRPGSLFPQGVADFNGDGKVDIVLRNYGTAAGQNAIWLLNGTTLSSVVDLPALATSTGFQIQGPK